MRVSALKRVDLPTFGNPTIPALNISADGNAGVYHSQRHINRRMAASSLLEDASNGLGAATFPQQQCEVSAALDS